MKTILRRLAAVVCAAALCLTPVSALSVDQAIELLEAYYVDELPADAYRAQTLDELFEAIGDPYTYYMSAEEYSLFFSSVEQEGTICGIGAAIEYTPDGIRITQLIEGGGAKDAGLRVGDLIIAADGVSCVPAEEYHRTLIVGEEGTSVTLTVRRTDGSVQDVQVERRVIQLHNTYVTFVDGVGWIDCDSFGQLTVQHFKDGISRYDANADHWVVDLRGNPGGYADAAVGTLGVFTGFGRKLCYRFADGQSFSTLYLGDAMTDKPAIVLVDNMSASASEIFSGGIRAEYAGIVLGGRTYGKGTAQIVLDEDSFPDLFDGDCLKLTAYRFYCSDGNTTDKIGVLPTLLVGVEYTDAVAALLKTDMPQAGSFLRIRLNGDDYFVALDEAQTEENVPAFAELLAALPPDVEIVLCSNGAEEALTAAGARARYGARSRTFSDISDSPFAAEIETFAVYRLLNGDGTGRFLPERTLTRAELAAMLTHLLNTSGGTSMGFSDVPADSWYADNVNTIASLGFMSGVGDGRFDPYGTLTQEQFIAVMGRLTRFLNFYADDHALALDEDALAAEFPQLSSWARVEASVMTDFSGNMLYAELSDIDPQTSVTREQAAATLCRILRTLSILSY